MSDTIDLTKFRIFDGLSNDHIDKFRDVLKIKRVNSGEILFNEGDVGDSIYLLLDGKVEINQALTLQMNKGAYDTREKAIINLSSEMHPSFGELSLLGEDNKRTATVKALTECDIGIIMDDKFFSILHSDYEIGYKIMKNVACIITDHLVKANQNVLKLTTAFSLILEK